MEKQSFIEIFSLIQNACFPVMNGIIKRQLMGFLNRVVHEIPQLELKNWILLLDDIHVEDIIEKNDLMNERIITITYLLYEEFLNNLVDQTSCVEILEYNYDEVFYKETYKLFVNVLLNGKLMNFYQSLYEIDLRRQKMSIYQDQLTLKNIQLPNDEPIQDVLCLFNKIKVEDELEKQFVSEFEEFCRFILLQVMTIDSIMEEMKQEYSQVCHQVFGPKIGVIERQIEQTCTKKVNHLQLNSDLRDFLLNFMS